MNLLRILFCRERGKYGRRHRFVRAEGGKVCRCGLFHKRFSFLDALYLDPPLS